MKKALKGLAFLSLILTVLVSCSDDDSSTANNAGTAEKIIEYRLTLTQPVLTSVSYRNAEGNMVAESNVESVTAWSKTITKSEGFFMATMVMSASAQMDIPVDYTMQILVDGVVKHQNAGTLTADLDIELSKGVQ